MSSSPALLTLCFAILKRMLSSKSMLMDPERNPVLSKILKATFYAQFCAGETKEEVARHMEMTRQKLGYDGIILDYAAEVLEVGEGAKEGARAEVVKKEVEHWESGLLATVDVARSGDFIGVKLSGLGSYALSLLKSNASPTPFMETAIHRVCTAARAKNISILFDAEEESTNAGIEAWVLSLQRKYNRPQLGRAMIYTTYQAYLQSAPQKLARDLEAAQKDGFILGIKLVRGAYLEAEKKRGVPVWSSKEETDKCYDAMASTLLTRSYNPIQPLLFSPPTTPFPMADLLLATHNASSIRKVLALRSTQVLTTPASHLPRLAYAQLQGMADEISQELVTAGEKMVDRPRVFKCMTWGSTTECLHFLMRRAEENKDAVERTGDTRVAMGRELVRRAKEVVGL
jgi:hypothetical protein